MRASVGVDIILSTEAEADVVLSITPADGWANDETLTIASAGRTIPAAEIADAHGTRAHRVVLPAGRTSVTYRGSVSTPSAPAHSAEIDPVRYLRPSRYAPSDDPRISEVAAFSSSSVRERVRQITQWVSENLDYVSGVSGPTETALDRLLARNPAYWRTEQKQRCVEAAGETPGQARRGQCSGARHRR